MTAPRLGLSPILPPMMAAVATCAVAMVWAAQTAGGLPMQATTARPVPVPADHAPLPHGTVVSPMSRVYRVYQSNPSNPNFALAANAIALDGTLSYYTWNEVSRNIPQAVQASLPPGFDYSPWIPDGQLASAGRVNPNSPLYPRTYRGLDQVSRDWPKTAVTAGQVLPVSFLATAPHNPSVWDVWMTTADWQPDTPLRWSHMEFLGRPTVTFTGTHYDFDITVPADRQGHHVLWVAWQRDDPVGEVFLSTSDLEVAPIHDDCTGATTLTLGEHDDLSLAGATRSAAIASCEPAGARRDVWFQHTALCTGTLRAATCSSGSGLDTTVAIWAGPCGSLAQLSCNDDACGQQSVTTATVSQGTSYWLQVSAAANSATDSFALSLSYDNGTGNFTTTTPSCGSSVTLAASGAPNLGGIVDYDVTGGTGTFQGLVFGFAPANLTRCSGCVFGVSSVGTLPARTSFVVPCDPGLVGTRWWLQGVDAFGINGGCNYGSGVDFALTSTIRTTVGN
ncbi:MAG: lytic polysaccharide monooxygenase [bacterium]|nr:lytic polysaccharide monooxygenase [bacterium]